MASMAVSSIASPPTVNNGRLSSLLLSTSKRLARKNACSLPLKLGSSSAVSTSTANAGLAFSPLPPVELSKKALGFSLSSQPVRRRPVELLVDKVAAINGEGSHVEPAAKRSFGERFPLLVTGFFFFTWFFLNVIFNILNKKLYNYFPYPYFVSVVHLLVGVVYCLGSWSVGLHEQAPMDAVLQLLLLLAALFHALGHVMSNVSFAAVAVSFTHAIKAFETFFSAAAIQYTLGLEMPPSLWLPLVQAIVGVSIASLTELSFNWTGFISAMISNIAFACRSICSKPAMTRMDSTNVYAYISIFALFLCIPSAVVIEGPKLLQHGFKDAIAKVGLVKFLSDLFWTGMLYHLYNQVAANTLERVSPLTHAVGNMLKRVLVIGFSIFVFGNKMSIQTGIGTAIAIAGIAIHYVIKADMQTWKPRLVWVNGDTRIMDSRPY